MGRCVRFSRRGGGLSPGHGHERVSVGGDRRRVRGGCRYRRLWSGVRHGRRSRPRGIDVLLARRVRRPKTGVTRGQGRETGAGRRRRRAVILGYNRRRRPSRPSRGANNPFGAVQGSTPGFTHAAPKPAGSALKGGLPPVPLFNATNPPGIDSPVPPGTAAAARAAQTQEAEGECDGLNPGLGGMEIGTGGGYVVPTHSEEHGYAPALASGDMTYSGDGGYVSGGGNSGPGSIGGRRRQWTQLVWREHGTRRECGG